MSMQLRVGLVGAGFIGPWHVDALRRIPGVEVVALIKAGWLELHAADTPATPGHNCMSGVIETILGADDGPSEVRIALPNGPVLCALAQPDALEALGAAEGHVIQVQFAPGNVLLGTPA